VRAGRCSIACRNTYVHSRAVFVQSTVRRFGRWLENDRIDVHALYGPFMPQALAEWGNHVLYLALDTSMWWDTDCLVRLALVYRGRVVPMLWTVLEYPSGSVAYEAYKRALDKVAELLPARCTVVLTADRGFADTHLMKHLTGLVGIGACVSKGVFGSTAMGCIPAR
jgi:hypothetical protein